jgi:hypothetical protein
MDRVRLAYDLVRAYVYALVVAAVATAVWLATPEVAAAPEVATLWFAVGGFGLLVLATFVLSRYSQRS